MQNQPKISYVMPAYNSESTIKAAIESILRQTIKPFEIIVVNDGSTDQTETKAKQYPVTIINKPNGGEASALNIGFKKASGDYIAIIESDVIIPQNWAQTLINEFTSDEILGAGGKLKVANPENLIAKLSEYELESVYGKIKSRFVPHITSANSLYKKQAYQIAGEFNEKMLNSCLDADFNQKLISKGYKLVLNKQIETGHFWKETLGGYIKRQFAYAFFRPYLKNNNLYPTDRILKIQIILAGLLMISLILSLFAFLIGINPLSFFLSFALLTILFLLIQFHKAVKMFFRKKDASAFLLPILALIRGITGFIGYLSGSINKFFARN